MKIVNVVWVMLARDQQGVLMNRAHVQEEIMDNHVNAVKLYVQACNFA